MTKNFKEGEEYDPVFSTWDNIQDFRNHIDDILMETHHYSVDTNQKYHTVWVHWDWDYKKGNKYVKSAVRHIAYASIKSMYANRLRTWTFR